jgi:sulfite exporter TauE/SafE
MAATPPATPPPSAAYAVLRTRWGRSEAYAGQAAAASPLTGRIVSSAAVPAAVPPLSRRRAVALIPARIWRGRPARLVLRIVAAVALVILALHTNAGTPAVAGLVTGIGMWLVLTVRADLAPPPGR